MSAASSTVITNDEVLSVLGRGPATETFLIRRSERELALKRIAPHACASADANADLVREGRILLALEGRGSPKLIETGHDARGPYVVTERCAGHALATFDHSAVRARFPALVVAAFSALAAVHEAQDADGPLGIVHGDVTASNLLASSSLDACVLVDFQLARDRKGGPRRDGAFRGTLATVAPEVARGEEPSERSDIFSLAVTLVDAVLGIPMRPEGLDPAVRLVLAAEEPLAFDAAVLAGWAPEAFANALEHCLSHHPADRPASAREVLGTLKKLR